MAEEEKWITPEKETDLFKLTRTDYISGAHKLPNHQGKCAKMHGHNWKVVSEITGTLCNNPKDPEFGMVVDFGVIKGIIDEFDHKIINDLVPNPTAELIARNIAFRIMLARLRISSVLITIWETENSSVQYLATESDRKVTLDVELSDATSK